MKIKYTENKYNIECVMSSEKESELEYCYKLFLKESNMYDYKTLYYKLRFELGLVHLFNVSRVDEVVKIYITAEQESFILIKKEIENILSRMQD